MVIIELISKRDIQRAEDVDLLSFLRVNDPGQLVHCSKDTYCTREHDSLKISNGKWYWFSRGFGGVNAMSYLQKVKGYSFVDAVNAILGENVYERVAKEPVINTTEKEFKLPKRNGTNEAVIRYLKRRGINLEIIQYCIDNGILYESAK